MDNKLFFQGMTPEVVFIISSEKGKHKRKHAKKRKKENSLIRCHSALTLLVFRIFS